MVTMETAYWRSASSIAEQCWQTNWRATPSLGQGQNRFEPKDNLMLWGKEKLLDTALV